MPVCLYDMHGMHAYACICMHVCVRLYMCVCTYIYICVCMCVHVCVYLARRRLQVAVVQVQLEDAVEELLRRLLFFLWLLLGVE
jgi:hypothetical protein